MNPCCVGQIGHETPSTYSSLSLCRCFVIRRITSRVLRPSCCISLVYIRSIQNPLIASEPNLFLEQYWRPDSPLSASNGGRREQSMSGPSPDRGLDCPWLDPHVVAGLAPIGQSGIQHMKGHHGGLSALTTGTSSCTIPPKLGRRSVPRRAVAPAVRTCGIHAIGEMCWPMPPIRDWSLGAAYPRGFFRLS